MNKVGGLYFNSTIYSLRQNALSCNLLTCFRYDRIQDVQEWRGEISSDHRKLRLLDLPVPSSVADVLSIMGDTKDEEYPLYRLGNPPDYLSTTATGTSASVFANANIILSVDKRSLCFQTKKKAYHGSS